MAEWDVLLTTQAPMGRDLDALSGDLLGALEDDPRVDAWTVAVDLARGTVSVHVGVEAEGNAIDGVILAGTVLVQAASALDWLPIPVDVEVHPIRALVTA